jgi:hypothetical protein
VLPSLGSIAIARAIDDKRASEKPAAAEAIAVCLRKSLRVFFIVFEFECAFAFARAAARSIGQGHLVSGFEDSLLLDPRK